MSKKIQTLLERIMAKLNLTEAGKIQHFLDKQKTVLERENKACKKNIEYLTYNHETNIEKLQEQLEDAKVELEATYTNVTANDVETNAKQDDYSSTYWGAIERAESKVERITKQISDASDKLKDQIKDVEEQIKERERRIEKIS